MADSHCTLHAPRTCALYGNCIHLFSINWQLLSCNVISDNLWNRIHLMNECNIENIYVSCNWKPKQKIWPAYRPPFPICALSYALQFIVPKKKSKRIRSEWRNVLNNNLISVGHRMCVLLAPAKKSSKTKHFSLQNEFHSDSMWYVNYVYASGLHS